MAARTIDPLVSPVPEPDLADWLVAEVSDPLLPGALLGATGAVIEYTQYDLISREWQYTAWNWPIIGTSSAPSISRNNYALQTVIGLPYANIISVDGVEAYGESVQGYIVRTDAIVLPQGVARHGHGLNEDPAISVTYHAGYGATAADVPDAIKRAIIMCAAFMYEHRGECDATGALKRSGAAELLTPYINPRKLAAV